MGSRHSRVYVTAEETLGDAEGVAVLILDNKTMKTTITQYIFINIKVPLYPCSFGNVVTFSRFKCSEVTIEKTIKCLGF